MQIIKVIMYSLFIMQSLSVYSALEDNSMPLRKVLTSTQEFVNDVIHTIEIIKNTSPNKQEYTDQFNNHRINYFNNDSDLAAQAVLDKDNTNNYFFLCKNNIPDITIQYKENRPTTIQRFYDQTEKIISLKHDAKISTIEYYQDDSNYSKIIIDSNKKPIQYFYEIISSDPFKTRLLQIKTPNILHKDYIIEAKVYKAWHEAGHAIASIYREHPYNVELISIQESEENGTIIESYVQCTPRKEISFDEKSIKELEGDTITALCGGAAEQFLLEQHPFESTQDIINHFSLPQYKSDLHNATLCINKIIEKQNNSSTTYEFLLTKLYHLAYQKIEKHLPGLQALVYKLTTEEVLQGKDVYKTLGSIRDPL